jgi:hypothetical protein
MLYPETERRNRIFLEIDQSLLTLGWDLDTARGYLKEQFNCVSRHQLSDFQLDQINHQLDCKASLVKPTK